MISTYFMNCLIGNAFGSANTDPLPSEYYIGLSTTPPQADGSEITEPDAPEYVRLKVICMSEPSDGSTENTEDLLFPGSLSDWGHISHYVVFDSLTGGHFLFSSKFYDSAHISVGRAVRIKTGDLVFTLTNINESITS